MTTPHAAEPRRATVRQADIARAIKALAKAGYSVAAIRLHKDGFEIVSAPAGASSVTRRLDGGPKVVI
jgi:hypothetical protein